jgi:hypothetical protein
MVKVRTTRTIDDPENRGVKVAANVEIDLPEAVAEKLIAEGKAEKVNGSTKSDK